MAIFKDFIRIFKRLAMERLVQHTKLHDIKLRGKGSMAMGKIGNCDLFLQSSNNTFRGAVCSVLVVGNKVFLKYKFSVSV